MNILIVGAGTIGFPLTKRLAQNHDITLIESDPQKARRATEQLDAIVLEGDAGSYRMLRKANLPKADIVAAMTNSDELNILICQMAKHAGVPTTVARVRNHEYTAPDFIIPRYELGPDLIIHPEKETAFAINRLIRQSMCTDVLEFEGGKIQVVGIRLEKDAPIIRIPLKDLGSEIADLPMRIVAINRKERTLIPKGDDFLSIGDQAFVIIDPEYLPDLMRITGKTDTHISNVMILGGGLIGQFVARELSKDIHTKIIESREEKSQEIADLLPRSLIIHGDGTDIDLLAVEGIMDMDAFIAVTGKDETNIIATLVARHLQVPRTIALVNKLEYMPITPTIGMDAVVSKQLITVNTVQRYIHQKEVASIASIPGIDAQIIEYIAPEKSKITRKPLKDVHFPKHALVGAVIQNDHVLIPKGDTQIQPGDRVFMIFMPQVFPEVERLFR